MNNLNDIKWAGLLPSMNIFSGELGSRRVSLCAMGLFYELRSNNKGQVYTKRINEPYLSIAQKKEIIASELLSD